MKRFFLSLLMIAGVYSATMAQSAQYEQVMSKNITELESPATFTPVAMTEKAALFERIGDAEKTQWQPYYYAAYCNVMNALMTTDRTKVDGLADKAEADITKAEQMSPKNSEISCIKSLIATARLKIDPMTRGQQYGPIAAAALEEAKTQNPENPRVYMLIGQSLYFTPEQFGGSKEKAKTLFELALQKFAAFKPANTLDPTWGEAYTRGLLKSATEGK